MHYHRRLLLRIVVRWRGKVKLDLTIHLKTVTSR